VNHKHNGTHKRILVKVKGIRLNAFASKGRIRTTVEEEFGYWSKKWVINIRFFYEEKKKNRRKRRRWM
jgi:hypothetical protein